MYALITHHESALLSSLLCRDSVRYVSGAVGSGRHRRLLPVSSRTCFWETVCLIACSSHPLNSGLLEFS